MVFSNRSSAAILAVATVLMSLSILFSRVKITAPAGMDFRSGRFREWISTHPFLVIFGLFFFAAAIGVPFTANPVFHGWRLLEFLVPVALSGLMLGVMRFLRLPTAFPALVFGLVFASLLTLVELRNGSPMRSYFGLRIEEYRLNRSVVMLLVLLFPLLAYALAWPQRRWIAVFTALLALIAILQSESGSAVFGLLAGGTTLLIALISWRLARNLVGLGMLAGIFTAPWQGIILTDIIPTAVHAHMRSTSSAIRVEIYRAFGWAVDYAPFFGSGFNSASQLEKEPAYRVIPEKLNHFLEFGHAHNAALQIWVEFGLFGALLAGILALLTLQRIETAPAAIRPAMLAFMASAFVIAMISHGAWQAWWAGALGVSIVLLVAIKDAMIAPSASPECV